MKKKIHLVCNAHLDPVWLWQWEDGAAEAVSTYRIAADFCEEEKEFVFNHNEALIYRYVEELDPQLFKRIQRLVKEKRWHIAGGSFVQPDVNAPRGESLIRQFLVGLEYFWKKFRQRPTTAYNFDSFGHPTGLPQILAGCGFDSYIFCRPGYGTFELPVGAFVWQDRSGSELLARRSDDHYLTNGRIKQKLDKWLEHYSDEPETLILWGFGNHGGGISRKEYRDLREYSEMHPEYTFIHSTPERYMQAIRRHVPGSKLPGFSGEIENCMAGCYTSSAVVKRAHRRMENLMSQTERLAALSWWLGASDYPKEDLDDAWRDILFTEFHDILPGSSIKPGEEDALARLGHTEENLRRIRLSRFVSLVGSATKAGEGVVPIFVFNPHSFPVHTVAECSYQLSYASPPKDTAEIVLRANGKKIPFQREKSEDNLGGDWRIKIAVPLKLSPFEIRRIDASYRQRKEPLPWKAPTVTQKNLSFQSRGLQMRIGKKTGLVDSLAVTGRVTLSCLGKESLCPVVFDDLDHSWICGDPGLARVGEDPNMTGTAGLEWDAPGGRFAMASAEKAAELSPPPHVKWGKPGRLAGPIRIIEEGTVRRVVEVVFTLKSSFIVRHYILYRDLPYFDIDEQILWGEKDKMLKIEVPLSYVPDRIISESLFSVTTHKREKTHVDKTCQRWLAAIGGDRFLAVINDGSFAYSLSGNRLYLNVLRSPAYSSFNLHVGNDRHEKRYLPRQSQGEHRLRFRFIAGKRFNESFIRKQADILNVPPMWQVYFPGGSAGGSGNPGGTSGPVGPGSTGSPTGPESAGSFLTISPDSVHLEALKKSERGDALIARLLETRGRKTRFELRLAGVDEPVSGDILPWSLVTLKIRRKPGGVISVSEVNLVEQAL